MFICPERGTNNLRMFQLMPLPPHHLLLHCVVISTFLVLAYPGCPGKEAIKQMPLDFGTTRVGRYQKGKSRKVKTNLDLLEQEISEWQHN